MPIPTVNGGISLNIHITIVFTGFLVFHTKEILFCHQGCIGFHSKI